MTELIYGMPIIDPDSPETMYWQGVWYVRDKIMGEWKILENNDESNTSNTNPNNDGTSHRPPV